MATLFPAKVVRALWLPRLITQNDMENTLNSSNSDPTLSGLKSVFKKPTNSNVAFEVSMNESTTGLQINRSDLDMDTTQRSNVFRPFKKQRNSIQGFNVGSHESPLNSESEQSRVLGKPKSIFSKKQTVDSFNVTFNESSLSPNVGTSLSESVLFKKTTLFRQCNKENEMSIRVEESEQVDTDDHLNTVNSDAENVDSTTFVTKQNPFIKSTKDTSDKLEVSGNDSVRSENGRIDADSTSWVTKQNPFGRRKSSSDDTLNLSLTEQHTCESTQRNKSALTDKEPANLSISMSKARSESYVNESSINDENLNNWMSDYSEDEIPPPVIPPVTRNQSLTVEKQNTPRMEKSPERTNWEEKLNDIISGAQKKTDVRGLTPCKPKPTKKTPTENKMKNNEKYRPKKLIKPASYATKGLYQFILKKFKSKYGIDAVLEAEDMVCCICDTVKKVLRRKSYQKVLIQSLKKRMAKAELVETTVDFYEFVIKFLPYDFRVKVVPCLQPISNTIYPPKDVTNPFDKIL